MFILIPIAINSSLTYKRAHVSSASDSSISNGSLRFLRFFSSNCSDRVLKRQRDRKGIEASTCTVTMRFIFLLPQILITYSCFFYKAHLFSGGNFFLLFYLHLHFFLSLVKRLALFRFSSL